MAHFNYSSNADVKKFYTFKYGSGEITKDSDNVYTINTQTTGHREAEAKLKLKNLFEGDLVTIECDVNAVGTLTLAMGYFEPVTREEKTAVKYQINIDNLNKAKITFVVPKKGDHTVIVGGGWGSDFKGTVSNIAISVKTHTAFALDLAPSMQRFVLQSTATGVFVVREDMSTNEVIISTSDANTLKITPKVKPNYRCQAFTNATIPGNSKNYTTRVDVDPYNNISLSFYDSANVIVPIANVYQNVYLGILLV